MSSSVLVTYNGVGRSTPAQISAIIQSVSAIFLTFPWKVLFTQLVRKVVEEKLLLNVHEEFVVVIEVL